jgi:diguanylate cyclase (GGDEF)-like protein
MNISQKIFLYFTLLFLQVMLLTISFLVILDSSDQLTETQIRQFESHKVAEELRKSSDDLTRMVRSYTATGDARYKHYFELISAIRDGKEPRPDGYHPIFWDYITASHEYTQSNGRSVSILQMMEELQFSKEEFSLLAESKALSDKLIKMEVQAFNAMNGLFIGVDGQYSKHSKPDPEMARKIVYGEAYHQEKSEIMSKLDEFFKAMELRIEKEIALTKSRQNNAYLIAVLQMIIILIFSISGYFYFVKNIVFPLREMKKKVKQVQNGEYTFTDTSRNDEIGLLLHEFVKMGKKISSMVTNLEQVARTDQLTKINNRIAIDEILETEKYKFDRYGVSCSLVMIDVDFFKNVNDQFGHIVGDQVLVAFAAIFEKHVRKSDVVGRWGGEEFMVVFPSTNVEQAKIIVEKIRQAVSQYSFPVAGHLTASFGISTFKKEESLLTTLNEADKALYRAKESGRNRVC